MAMVSHWAFSPAEPKIPMNAVKKAGKMFSCAEVDKAELSNTEKNKV